MLAERLEAAAGRGVDAKVADLDEHAAEEVGLEVDLELDGTPDERRAGSTVSRSREASSTSRAARTRATRHPRSAATASTSQSSVPSRSRGRPPTTA